MKETLTIISLNTWGGRIDKPFKEFLLKHQDTDIFCFQEIYHNAHGKDTVWNDDTNLELYNNICSFLPNHTGLFFPHLGDWWGLATFVSNKIKIIDHGEEMVHQQKGYDFEKEIQGHTAKNILYTSIETARGTVMIINFHGLWNGKGKTDTEDRLLQSQKIIDFLKTTNGDIIFCGDFNLNPDTQSIKILEEFGLRNLIKEYNITSTRTSYYTKEGKFADYTFISPKLTVKSFEVLPDEVSDHAAIRIIVKL